MPKQYICTYCEIITPNANTMRIHLETKKHKRNKEKPLAFALDEEEKKKLIIRLLEEKYKCTNHPYQS
jgi:hypothetical protein